MQSIIIMHLVEQLLEYTMLSPLLYNDYKTQSE